MNDSHPQVCVIGAGIIGSWAALHLAESGVPTTLFEQFPRPHTRGSSHGQSRAFRFLGEHELGRLDYSLERWQALEQHSGEELFVKTGLLNFGVTDDPELAVFMNVLRAAERPVEWFDSERIASQYPMLSYPGEWGAAWDPNGGILIAHACLTAVQNRFVELGGQIVTGQVQQLESVSGSGVVVGLRSSAMGATEELSFERAVLCAGPWTARLLPHLGKLLSTLLTPVTYWRDPSGRCSASSGFPIIFNARLTDIYGLPSLEYPGLVKMLYHGGPESDPDTRDQASFEPHLAKVRDYVREHLPTLEHQEPAILETCMYTMTPDGAPIIDRLDDGIVVGCGFSGSGFKHAPATGQMLASLALGTENEIAEDFGAWRYALDRFSEE